MGKVQLQLRNGNVITGEYEIDEYDDIYDAWQENRPIMAFSNCVVRTSDVLAIQWESK